MATLQDDILEIYNTLVMFSNSTVEVNFPKPITVFYEAESRLLVFEQGGKSVRLLLPNYYCFSLANLKKPTYLLPEDYDYLMGNLQQVINSGLLLENRVCISPMDYGFDIYRVDINNLIDGPDLLARIRFISGTSWLFKWKVKKKIK